MARPELKEYRKKRRFSRTTEPEGSANGSAGAPGPEGHLFVVQKHAASRLHYDLRLELDGVLKSWAVPKGPSLDPADRILAVRTEDHPMEYADFEGIIPEGEYGGGTVMVWDTGRWFPEKDLGKGLDRGKLRFRLEGTRLHGEWNLVRMKAEDGGQKNWLLIKRDDDEARFAESYDVRTEELRSVLSGRTMDEIADGAESGAVRTGGMPEAPPDAPRTDLPDTLKPELATSAAQTPAGDDWLHELKLDGYRMLAHIDGDEVRLLTRNGNDWTDKYPGVAEAIRTRLGALLQAPGGAGGGSILDGEMVFMRADGTTDFQALQNATKTGRTERIVFYAFDLPFFDGHDMRRVPLRMRKKTLADLIGATQEAAGGGESVRYSDYIEGRGGDMYEQACRLGVEGVVSKRPDSRYRSGRTKDWIKSKCTKRQEFVVGGWTQPSGSRMGFGSLLLGVYEDGDLVYAGRVGTGFDGASLSELSEKLGSIGRKDAPFAESLSALDRDGAHWVEPVLVVEVAFTEWTRTGRLRHPSFQGLRGDKAPENVVRESSEADEKTDAKADAKPDAKPEKPSMKSSRSPGAVGVRLTHPDRVLYPAGEITKRAIAEYYARIAPRMLEHVGGRPLMLLRCPEGQGEECFYQKHHSEQMPSAVGAVEVEDSDGTSMHVMVNDQEGLVSLAQMSVLEIHPWSARSDRLDRPDRIIFDLDPGEGASWDQVVQGARDVREVLNALDLRSFVRTTGGKGLHVVLPIERRSTWEDVKAFSGGVARGLARTHPDRYVAKMSKQARRGKIFVDHLRNRRGATAVGTYSTRARPGAPVATPLRWDELGRVGSGDAYTIENLPARLSRLKQMPWEEFFDVRQTITKDMLKAV